MKNDDDMTGMALDYIERGGPPAHVREAFQNIPRAPLATFIDTYLAAQPRINLASVLRQIAEINQGRLEDLDSVDFVSYLIERTGTDETTMQRVRVALGKFRRFVEASADGEARLSVAARDDSGGSSTSTTMNELLQQMKKRVK
jgi:hypothetical protein